MNTSAFAQAKDHAQSAAEETVQPSAKSVSISSSLSKLLGSKSGFSLNKAKSGASGLKNSKSHNSLVNGVSVDDKFSRLSTHVFHGISCETPVEHIYELSEEIGKGAFGVVYKARDRQTGLDFCCKTIPKELLTPEVFDNIKLEAEVMMHLRGHPNIVEIMGLFEDATHIHIVQELCTGGDLLSKVSKSLEPCSEHYAASIIRAVLLVIQHCHSCGVLYRDIKPDNFLLSSDGPDAVLKATDFGISKFMKPGETTDEFMGTPTYMAPEVFNMKCGFPSDIWSAGVMLYWLLSGDFPFKGSNKMQLGMQVLQQDPCMEGDGWNEVSNEAKDVISLMLIKEPEERATVNELLAHKWFKQVPGAKARPPGNMLLRRLRLFANVHEFKKEALRCTIRILDAEYLVGVRAMFDAMDTSNSGSITLEELLSALERQGCKADRKEVASLFNSMDVEQKGELSFEEFGAATLNHSLLEKKGLLRALFAEFDRKSRGYISEHDLEAVLKNNGNVKEKTIQKIMAQVDLNQDGKINFNEFAVMMFGENAGLQRLGRGKSSVWSYQNSRESTGALRDASGNLLKAPNLSSYRKVNNPYSASFMSSGKHQVSCPKAPSPLLPTTPYFQKLSHKDRSSPQLHSRRSSGPSITDMLGSKRISGSGMPIASGSDEPLSPSGSLCHTPKEQGARSRSAVALNSGLKSDGDAADWGEHMRNSYTDKAGSGSNSNQSSLASKHGPMFTCNSTSPTGTVVSPGALSSSLQQAPSGIQPYSLPEDGLSLPPPPFLQQQASLQGTTSERSSRYKLPQLGVLKENAAHTGAAQEGCPEKQFVEQQPGWQGSGEAHSHSLLPQRHSSQDSLLKERTIGSEIKAQECEKGGSGSCAASLERPKEGYLIQQATDTLATCQDFTCRGGCIKSPATAHHHSSGCVRFADTPNETCSPCVEVVDSSMHRLSVGSHAHSPMPSMAHRLEGFTPGRVSLPAPSFKQSGSRPDLLYKHGDSNVHSVGGADPPSPNGSSHSHSLNGNSSSRFQRQSSLAGIESGSSQAHGLAASGGGCFMDALHSSNSYSSNSTGRYCRHHHATSASDGEAAMKASLSSSSKKYGWGKSRMAAADSAPGSPDLNRHGVRRPAPNISSRQSSSKSIERMSKSQKGSRKSSTGVSRGGGSSALAAEQGSSGRQNKVDHHKGVVDCVIS